jgi:hypothetical protein
MDVADLKALSKKIRMVDLFVEKYYNVSISGLKIQKFWLCHSPLQKAYCEPCWLFADRRSGASDKCG